MIVVFAGPTFHGLSPRAFNGVEIRAPAVFGDVIRAAREGATAIGLIDGYFEQSQSVWHKEILLALDEGVQIFGAASLGALRAVECEAFGMVGVGEIFAEYRNGIRHLDADVAVTFGPAELDFVPLSLSQVDVEHTLMAMCAQELISTNDAELIKTSSREIYFKNRTIAALARANGVLSPSGFAEMLTRNWVNKKQQDCKVLLDAIQRIA